MKNRNENKNQTKIKENSAKINAKNKKIEDKSGITLVALVVTIVVLMILAGVSINLVLGQNGIITKAEEARNAALNDQIASSEAINKLSNELDEYLGEKRQ